MKRYVYSYLISSTGETTTLSIPATSEEEANNLIRSRAADAEFTDESDIEHIRLVKQEAAKNTYYECEGCT